MKKPFYVIGILMSLFLLQGCGPSLINLKNSPSDMLLLTVKPNNKETVKYSVSSNLPVEYTYEIQTGVKYKMHVNRSFEENVKSYMLTKFSKLDQNNETISVEITLKDLKVDYNDDYNFGSYLTSSDMNSTFEIKITSNVIVKKDGETILQKNIISSSNETKTIKNDKERQQLLAEVINNAISKNLIMLDKYLVSNEI